MNFNKLQQLIESKVTRLCQEHEYSDRPELSKASAILGVRIGYALGQIDCLDQMTDAIERLENKIITDQKVIKVQKSYIHLLEERLKGLLEKVN